jgi:hypothetical protein
MNNYIKKSHNKTMKERKEFTIFGNIQVFVKDALPDDIDLTNVIMDLEDSIPAHLFYEVETVLVGKFKEVEDRGLRAVYLDGGIYVTNEQPSEEQLFEDIVHEVAHAVEKMFEAEIYSDDKVEKEYLGKKKRFLDLLSAGGVKVPSRLRYETEYSKLFDEFLFYQLGYDAVAPYCQGLFLSPYSSVSISEYFATAFEFYFVQSDPTYVRKISPELFEKLNKISEIGV